MFRRRRVRAAVGTLRSLAPPVVLAVLGAAAGFVAAAVLDTSQKTHENIQLASLTLLFGALLGGVVKLLLDDVQRDRERRAEQTRFIAKMLDDLKSVYDRVERTRILLPAHRSALTYGKEMRDLIDARVQLRNVVRAIDAQTSGISTEIVDDLKRAVAKMESYLEKLTDEFQLYFKPISDKQKIHEAVVSGTLKALDKTASRDARVDIGDENEAWTEISTKLQAVRKFIGDWSGETEPPALDKRQDLPPTPDAYRAEFEAPLDLASWLLRSELQKPGQTARDEIPSDPPKRLRALADRLREESTGAGGTEAASQPESPGSSQRAVAAVKTPGGR